MCTKIETSGIVVNTLICVTTEAASILGLPRFYHCHIYLILAGDPVSMSSLSLVPYRGLG